MDQERRETISNRMVAALDVTRDTVFWDRELTGFGVRAYPSGGRAYVAQTRGPEGSRRVTVGRHGVINADEARRRAALIIARVKAGEEPLPASRSARPANGPTVAELAARYLEEHVAVRCKPKTAETARTTVNRYILPALGKLPSMAVRRTQVMALHHRLADRPAMANAVLATLSHMYTLAEGWGAISEGTNPCRSVVKYPARRRERFLTDAEFDRLGRVLDEAPVRGGASPAAIAAIRLLMLTGCRKNEILALRWEDVDLEAGDLTLADAKTGPRTVSLSPAAVKLLAGLPREPGNPWVIPGHKAGTHMRTIDDAWYALRARAGLDDVRLHDLRHSFASRALALGESLPMIGKLLGHSRLETTARYAHLARDTIHEAAARVADSIAADILDEQVLDPRETGWLPCR